MFGSLVTLLAAGCGAAPADEVVGVEGHAAAALPVLTASVFTAPLHSYDDAPRTVDSDDPAIWVNPRRRGEGLVIGALKDAGLQVYDLAGNVVQTIVPAFRPAVSAEDPPVPGPQPDPGTGPCPDSESGEVFGRFNNVDVQYDVSIRLANGRTRRIDVAVVTDRGCDRLRIFSIDPGQSGGPLVEITAPDAPRLWRNRLVQLSPFQSPGAPVEYIENDLDDQSTGYGVTLWRPERRPNELRAFVTQRRRAVLGEYLIFAAGNGKLSYRQVREYRFNPVFRIPAPAGTPGGHIDWTPCREDPFEDPQFEGLVVDQHRSVLYAAQEVIGIWRIPLHDSLPAVVTVPPNRLLHPTKSFGAGYFAVPDDDEFSCEDSAPEEPVDGTIEVAGNPNVGGEFLEADAEGLAIYYRPHQKGYLIASSQGDNTFHIFDRAHPGNHLAAFMFEGVGDTDGHEVVNVPVGDAFQFGLFALQNGAATGPESEDDINGFEYDGSTQFEFLGWEEIAATFGLAIDEDGFDPRNPHE
jgi:3-phytase